jgi:DNA-binding response OmpR family regulator
MRAHNTKTRTLDRMNSAFVTSEPRVSEPRSASIHVLKSSSRPGEHRSDVPSTRMPPTSRNESAELLVDVDGLSILVRFLVKDVPAEMQSRSVSKDVKIHLLLSRALEKAADRMRGSALRNDDASKQPLSIIESTSAGEPSVAPPATLNETVLRVGPLELDLLDRTAKRGDRQIDLRPREFRLLKYMMQRHDELLTRATLLKDVWYYKFLPETNLVDVHMGRLRRKVDAANEAPVIRNVRGVGFILSATPALQSSLSRSAERPGNPPQSFFRTAEHAT